MSTFNSLCTPAKIYLVIAVISSVVALSNHVKVGAVVMKMVFGLFWTFVLSWLCKKGYDKLSWFLVLLPYVILLLAALKIANLSQYNSVFKSVGIQGAYGQEGMTGKKKM